MEDLPFSFQLKDGRLCTIRLVAEDDAAEFCAFVPQIDAESDFLMRFPGEFMHTLEEEKAWLKERIEREDAIRVVAEIDGRIIASAGAESSKLKREAHHATLGVSVLKAFWGQGVGRRLISGEPAYWVIRSTRKMYLAVFDDNDRAIRLYESLGFVQEGRLRGDLLRGDGRYGDMIIMARHYVK